MQGVNRFLELIRASRQACEAFNRSCTVTVLKGWDQSERWEIMRPKRLGCTPNLWHVHMENDNQESVERIDSKGPWPVFCFFCRFGTSWIWTMLIIVDPFCTIYHRIYMSNRLPPRARSARWEKGDWSTVEVFSRSPKNHRRNAENCQERSRILRDHQVIYWFMGFLLDFQLKYCLMILMILIPGGIPSSRTRVIRLQVNNRTQ